MNDLAILHEHCGKVGVCAPPLPQMLVRYQVDPLAFRMLRIDARITRGQGAGSGAQTVTIEAELAWENGLIATIDYRLGGWNLDRVEMTKESEFGGGRFLFDKKTAEHFMIAAQPPDCFSPAETAAALVLADQAFSDLPVSAPEPQRDLEAEVQRLQAVIRAADEWRDTLDLDDVSFSGVAFYEGFEHFDDARDAIQDLIPMPDDEA